MKENQGGAIYNNIVTIYLLRRRDIVKIFKTKLKILKKLNRKQINKNNRILRYIWLFVITHLLTRHHAKIT